MLKNRVTIIINDFGCDWSDFPFDLDEVDCNQNYELEKFRCLDAKEKILVSAESDDVCVALLKVYYEAASVCERLANERNNKYKMCPEFHEFGNLITIRLERFEDNSLSNGSMITEVNSFEIDFDKSSLFSALAESFYKMLNTVICQEKSLLISKSKTIPYIKVKSNDYETMEWKLDTKR